jgi:hypothetical protein
LDIETTGAGMNLGQARKPAIVARQELKVGMLSYNVMEASDAYPDFVGTLYGPLRMDVSVPKLGDPLFIAVMDGHFNVTNGCMVSSYGSLL